MSNLQRECEAICEAGHGGRLVDLLIKPHEKDLGGFSVRRLLPSALRRQVGPWVFFDHMGPAEFGPGPGINVRPHPHVNLATVTYLFEGEMLHRDSLGSVVSIHPGDINLMVAGRGIVHSERETEAARAGPRRLHGLQLWLALPEADEEIDPAFHHYPSADIPAVDVEGVRARVMMGSAWGATSPVKTFAETLYVEADLNSGQSILLPEAEERALYVASGRVRVGDCMVDQHQLAVLKSGAKIELLAEQDTRVAMIGGQVLGPRFMNWNFVSSRRERIEQARRDWKAGRFPKVPGDEAEFIPLPE